MKNLIIIIGTIVLGVLIVTNFVLKDDSNSLFGASKQIMIDGTSAIKAQTDFYQK